MGSNNAARNARAVYSVGSEDSAGNLVPVGGYTTPVALDSPPATLTAGANTLTFASAVKAIPIDATGASVDIGWRIDGGDAGPGSPRVRYGSAGTVYAPGGVTSISLYVASDAPLNDETTEGNVNVGGLA